MFVLTTPDVNGVVDSEVGVTPRMSLMTVTPQLAAQWLARGGDNRRLRSGRVRQYAGAMARGEWRVTGESIVLDRQGRVRNGQHRLSAVVVSQTPIQTYVAYGVLDDAFDVMDRGAPRSVADVLGLHGHVNQVALGGTVRLLLTHERTGTLGSYGSSTDFVTPPVVLAYVEAHPDVHEGVRLAGRIRKHGVVGGDAIWAFCLTLFLRIDEEDARVFAERVCEGANLQHGDPVLVLRNRMMTMPRRAGGSAAQEAAALIIKAWNAYKAGEKITLLRWVRGGARPEEFPVPLGG